jgi:hypothetical protein
MLIAGELIYPSGSCVDPDFRVDRFPGSVSVMIRATKFSVDYEAGKSSVSLYKNLSPDETIALGESLIAAGKALKAQQDACRTALIPAAVTSAIWSLEFDELKF